MYKSNIRNKRTRGSRNDKNRELLYPEEGQEYGFVKDMLGNGRVNVHCEDGKIRVGRIRGSMRKFKHKAIITNGDIIIISRRDYEDDKVDVIHKYTFEEANNLNYRGELPEKIGKAYQQKDNSTFSTNHDDSYVVFADGDSEGLVGGATVLSKDDSSSDSDGSLDVDAI